MNGATALVLILSNQGYWFGGQSGTITLRPATEIRLPDAVLVWQLGLGPTRVAEGRLPIRDGKTAWSFELAPPEVRVRTTMTWSYRLEAQKTGRPITHGSAPVHLFPRNLVASLRKRVGEKGIFIVERQENLTALLTQAGVACVRLDHVSKLQSARADAILVGADEIDDSPFAQAPLINHAKSGASLFVFVQKRCGNLLGYPLAIRAVPDKLEWRRDHPLFHGFGGADLRSFLTGGPCDLRPIRLPTDEPVLEMAYWPRESPGSDPVPIDAIVAVKAVGAGRIVLCQLPLGRWEQDPRAQQIVANAVEYLLTPAAPTPRPSRRPHPTTAESTTVPNITIPSGVKP